jgi:hypothetical protein
MEIRAGSVRILPRSATDLHPLNRRLRRRRWLRRLLRRR